MNAANPVILERALTRPPKEADLPLRGDSVGNDRYICAEYLSASTTRCGTPSGTSVV